MNEIIQAVEGTDENYVIIDVRNVDEIDYTGKLSPVVHTLPLPYIVQYGVFNLDNEDFEDSFDLFLHQRLISGISSRGRSFLGDGIFGGCRLGFGLGSGLS